MEVYKSFSPTEVLVRSNLKICKDCKFYVLPLPPHEKNKKLGKCALFGKVNLIDGEVDYRYVSEVRPALCDGKYYKYINSPPEE